MNLLNKKIAFLGDSITEGVGATAHEKCYVERLKEIACLAKMIESKLKEIYEIH